MAHSDGTSSMMPRKLWYKRDEQHRLLVRVARVGFLISLGLGVALRCVRQRVLDASTVADHE